MFYKETDFKGTTIGKIPREWGLAELEKIAGVETGGNAPQGEEYFRNGKYPFVRVQHFDGNRVYVNKWDLINEKAVDKYRLKPFPRDSTVFPKSGASINLEKRAMLPCESYVVNHLCVLIPKTNMVDSKFLFYLMKRKNLSNNSAGTTLPYLNLGSISKLQNCLPPLSEQKEIVEILSCVDLAIQKTDEVIAKTEHLKSGLMKKLLTEGLGHKEFKDTEIGKIPKEWEVTSIDDECIVGTGGTPSRTNPQYYGGEIPWVKSTEVDYCIIRETEETLTEYGLQNSNAKVYPTGSLVIALYGQGITRGKCAIFGIDAAVNQACAVIQSRVRVYIPFLFYWFQKSYSWIRSLSQGANQSNLNMAIIRSLKFPLPPRLEQVKIAEILSTLDNKLGLERDQRTRIGRIKLGLMDLLLTGKIRVRMD